MSGSIPERRRHMPDDFAELKAAILELANRVDGQLWPRWLSVPLAANYSSLGQKSIRNLCANGTLTPSRAVRGKLLIDRQQLDAALLAECGRQLRKGRGIR